MDNCERCRSVDELACEYLETIRKLEKELATAKMNNARMKHAIRTFCEGASWAADAWKQQEHIKPLFDIDKEARNGK